MVAENPGPYGQVEGIAGQDINVDSDVNTGNFGYYHSGSIGDQTYLDVNRDGLYLAENDEVLAGVIIDLYSGSCPADLATLGLPIGLTATDANGNYLFEYIAAGDYCVLARDPGQGTQTQGTVGQSVTVTGGAVLTADFGYVPRGELGDLSTEPAAVASLVTRPLPRPSRTATRWAWSLSIAKCASVSMC